ncbi:MAG: DUF47 family protein [Candidatus Lokiarchaeota archaeon]|nr:DUF47 family protein [Candidatus Lokiarchaeota archaeon]
MFKKQKYSLQDLFDQDADIVKQALQELSNAVHSHCMDDRVSLAKYSEETIALEKRQDRLTEEIIARMFGKETMVFSRPDRIFIIKELDKIVDLAEFAVRKLLLYRPEPNAAINLLLEEMSTIIKNIGISVEKMIHEVFLDFDTAKKSTVQITDLRREVRRLEWNALEKIFSSNLPAIEFRYYETIIMQISRVADKAEEFADSIYEFICKYAL